MKCNAIKLTVRPWSYEADIKPKLLQIHPICSQTCIILQEIVDFDFVDSVLGMNFIPREHTLTIARFGLKHFERLCIPIGITWFSKMFNGTISGEYRSISTWGLKAVLLKLDGPCLLKNCFCWLYSLHLLIQAFLDCCCIFFSQLFRLPRRFLVDLCVLLWIRLRNSLR